MFILKICLFLDYVLKNYLSILDIKKMYKNRLYEVLSILFLMSYIKYFWKN